MPPRHQRSGEVDHHEGRGEPAHRDRRRAPERAFAALEAGREGRTRREAGQVRLPADGAVGEGEALLEEEAQAAERDDGHHHSVGELVPPQPDRRRHRSENPRSHPRRPCRGTGSGADQEGQASGKARHADHQEEAPRAEPGLGDRPDPQEERYVQEEVGRVPVEQRAQRKPEPLPVQAGGELGAQHDQVHRPGPRMQGSEERLHRGRHEQETHEPQRRPGVPAPPALRPLTLEVGHGLASNSPPPGPTPGEAPGPKGSRSSEVS